MSKDLYYHLPRNSGVGTVSPTAAATSVDGMSLPSFPSTSYWYDAHSSIGINLFPPGTSTNNAPGTSYAYKQEHCEPKSLVSERHIVDPWSDGVHQGNSIKNNYDTQYWNESSTQRGYVSPCTVADDNLEYEPMQVMAPDISPHQEAHQSEGSIYSMDSLPAEDVDDRLTSASVASSEEYYPQSNSSGYSVICNSNSNKKHSQDPVASPDEAKKNLKRLKKDVKEKVKEEKRCGVCGDAARSMHFGGMACDSCKAFFRRSVQSGAYKNFQCPENEQCPISKQNRKVCQYCRFKKSQENGMEVSWVMSETDRMTLWKNRLAKQRHVQEEKIKEEVYGDLPRALDPEEADKLKNLAALQEETFSSISYPDDCYGDRVESLANLFVCICKKLGLFFYKVKDFSEVCKADQTLLLKNGIGMSIYLHGAYMYDYENNTWPSESNKEALKIPPITVTTLKKFTVYPEAFSSIMKFYTKYGKELKDEIILALMCVIAFFQPDDPQFLYPGKIQDIQVTYLEHLRHYLLAKEGDSGVKVTFPKLLVGLADIREILEFHSKVDIKPTINHQQISTQNSIKSQMAILQDLFTKGAQGFFPEFSSVLTASERQQPLWKCSEKAFRTHRQRSGGAIIGTDQFYHPHTNQIFGGDPRTDMILTNPMEQIDRFMKKHKLSIAQVSEVAGNNHKSGAVRTKYFKKNNRDHVGRIYSSENMDSTEAESWPSSGQMQLVPHNEVWDNRCSYSTDKKRVVEVLCDILKHISCSDDNDEDAALLQSLKKTLPPQFLDNLAQKFPPA